MKAKKNLERCPANLSQLSNIVGIDEVGRGCLAGPVVVGAVILPIDFQSNLIRDSKKLSEKQREVAYDIIIANAIVYSVQHIQAKRINEVGINKAIHEATANCMADITSKGYSIDHILVDGNQFDNPVPKIPYTTIIKGDDIYLSIAAASILAKVKRDNYMKKVHEVYPQYNFNGSKGYYCQKHVEGLLKYGKCPYHRDQYVETTLKNLK